MIYIKSDGVAEVEVIAIPNPFIKLFCSFDQVFRIID